MTHTLILIAIGVGQSVGVGKGLDVQNFILSKNYLSATTVRASLISFMYQWSVLLEIRPERTADPVLLSRGKGNNVWCLAPSSPKRVYPTLSLSRIRNIESTLPSRFVAEEFDQLTMFSVVGEWEYKYKTDCELHEVFFSGLYVCICVLNCHAQNIDASFESLT